MDEMKIMVLNLEQFMNDAYIAKVNQKDQRTRVSGSERLSEDIATPSCYMRGKEKDSKKYKPARIKPKKLRERRCLFKAS